MLYLIIKSKEEGRVCVSGGQRLYIWLWLPYSTIGTTSLGIFVQRKIPNKRPAASSRSVEAALNGSRFGDKVLLRRERGDARVKIKLVLYIL